MNSLSNTNFSKALSAKPVGLLSSLGFAGLSSNPVRTSGFQSDNAGSNPVDPDFILFQQQLTPISLEYSDRQTLIEPSIPGAHCLESQVFPRRQIGAQSWSIGLISSHRESNLASPSYPEPELLFCEEGLVLANWMLKPCQNECLSRHNECSSSHELMLRPRMNNAQASQEC